MDVYAPLAAMVLAALSPAEHRPAGAGGADHAVPAAAQGPGPVDAQDAGEEGDGERLGAARPNFIFVLTDDQGWADAACLGHPYAMTPAIDRLAREGVRFEQFYVAAPACSPSRVGFLTGRHPSRQRVHTAFSSSAVNAKRGMPDWLDPDTTTVCDLLRDAGYTTGHFGKWHLCGREGEPPLPAEYGIDVARVFSGHTGVTGFREEARDEHFKTSSTELFVDDAIRFVRANKDRPFYVNLWTTAPHVPIVPTAEQLEPYAELEVDPADFPPSMRRYLWRMDQRDKRMRTYLAAITAIDTALGRLLDCLDEEGLAERTVVVFASDNGPEDAFVLRPDNPGAGSTGALRGHKLGLLEGGIRVPLIVRWPGHVAAGRVDATSVLSALDFLPTVCSLAGVDVPAGLDGEDASDVLLAAPRERAAPLFWNWRGKGSDAQRLAVRSGRWKLLASSTGEPTALYDLEDDPAETRDLRVRQPQRTAELAKQLSTWRASLPD